MKTIITQVGEIIFDYFFPQVPYMAEMLTNSYHLISFVYLLLWPSASQTHPAVVTIYEGLFLDFS